LSPHQGRFQRRQRVIQIPLGLSLLEETLSVLCLCLHFRGIQILASFGVAGEDGHLSLMDLCDTAPYRHPMPEAFLAESHEPSSQPHDERSMPGQNAVLAAMVRGQVDRLRLQTEEAAFGRDDLQGERAHNAYLNRLEL
jgi:hypothetical protein